MTRDLFDEDEILDYQSPEEIERETQWNRARDTLVSMLRERTRVLLSENYKTGRDLLLLELRKELTALATHGDLLAAEWVLGTIRELTQDA